MSLISALQFLRLNEIPEAWVDAVWDLEFTKRIPLDDTIAGHLSVSGDKDFRTLYQLNTNPNICSIWSILGENHVSIKSLVAVLSFFVLAGKAKKASVQQRVSGLHAASLYLLLLGVQGSIAAKVFHEVLLDTCSDLTSHCWPQDSRKKRKKDGPKSSQADGKRSRPQWKDTPEMEVNEADDEEEEEEEDEEELHFSAQDLVKIRDAVVLLVQSLLRLLQTFSLKDRPQSADNCTQIFSKLLHFEPVTGEMTFANPHDVTQLRSVPEMAFCGLQVLCSSKHGDQKESLRRVFHQLLYIILMMNKGDRGKPSLLIPSQAVLSTRDQTIHFVCHLVNELKEIALPVLQILLQHICFQMVEKSDFRSHGAQAVGMLTSQMTSKDYACFIKWLFKFSNSSKMVCRLFSVDVVMVLLEQPERGPQECQDPELSCFLPHKFLIQNLLFARRVDESPSVQGHALACLAQCLELPSFNVTRAVHNLFSASMNAHTLLSSHQTQKSYQTLLFKTVEITSADSFQCEGEASGSNHSNDLYCISAALVGLMKHSVIPLSLENLATLSERCRDPAVSVKKKAMQCVAELLAAKPDSSMVQKAWLQSVVSALVDPENSVRDKALEALDQVLLSHLKPYSASLHLDAGQRLTWDLLGLLCSECRNLSWYFSRAFTIWSKQNKFTEALIGNLISHTEADHAAGAWLLLSKVTASSIRVPHGKILDAWDTMIRSKNVTATTCCHILCVMGDIAEHLNKDTKDRIVADLMSWLKTFTLSLDVICAAVETLYQLGRSKEIKQTQAFLSLHCGELMSVCEAYLAGVLLRERGAQNLNEELMVKHLHTLGVASLHCPAKVSKRTVLLVESVLMIHSDKLPSNYTSNCFFPDTGKLCLQHEELVKKYLPVFARELEVGTEVAVRNNLVVIMCDLSIRYTNRVDNYIPNISACLQDSEAVIRVHTLIMLTNLLQEEFVKWKGSLFFHFMVALVDPVPSVVSLCEYCLVQVLLKDNPEMFSQHFIECIFHFSDYNKHKSYNRFPQSEREKARFSLKGPQHREKRFRIYRFLLEHFTDTQRFNITVKINQTILACFADEELQLDADGAEVLSETFNILSLKEIKLQAMSAPIESTEGEEPEDENMATIVKAVLQVAQKKVVSQVQKKAFIENTVPLIISLKSLLEQKRSPVLRDLMAYLHVTMQDYRNEVKDLFSGDEQLAAELEFDLKTAEKESEISKQVDNCSLTREARIPPAQVKDCHGGGRCAPSSGFSGQVRCPPPVHLRHTSASTPEHPCCPTRAHRQVGVLPEQHDGFTAGCLSDDC
uniref:Condensin complex subunit 1 C-terminal domain-containing protein n=1 Tax=Gasterosteus aculeatus aculeatus TaxID=481459 RepID=A0AAQ4SAF4_GASAC